MKSVLKMFAIFAVVALCLSGFAATRTFYLTRHGQVGDKKYYYVTELYKEPKLTPLGEEQAKLLGKYLKSIGFKGHVYASPLYRTMQTGTFAANEFGGKVSPEPGMQEFAPPRKNKKHPEAELVYGINDKWGMTPEVLKQEFPDAVVTADFVFPWRVKNEDTDKRNERLAKLIEEKLANTQGDLLFVGHGASVGSFNKAMRARGAKVKGSACNCCLFKYVIDEKGQVVEAEYLTENYLSGDQITNNLKKKPEKKDYNKKASKKARKKSAKLEK